MNNDTTIRFRLPALAAALVAMTLALVLAGCSGAPASGGSGSSAPTGVLNVEDVEGGEADFERYESSREGAQQESGELEGVRGAYGDDSVPEGMPQPVEPQDATVDKTLAKTCYLTVTCATLLDHMDELAAGKEGLVPADGVLYARQAVTFYEGESVFDVLSREMRASRIPMEHSSNPAFNSVYIEGINNLYEFDCGDGSGWMYLVNGWIPNYGCSRYAVREGDEIVWAYTCDLGADLG